MSDPNHQPHLPTPEDGYDRRDARAGLIALISGSVVLVLVVMIVGVYWLYQVYSESVDQAQYSGVASKELLAIREREDAHLHKYGYIDKEKGVVRIPIDRAIELVATGFSQGKVFYNTTTYPVKPEPPGGAAAPAQVPAPAAPVKANATSVPAK